MIIIAARTVPCTTCKAVANEPCTFVWEHPNKAMGSPMVSVHPRRSWDAQEAQRAVNALLDQ